MKTSEFIKRVEELGYLVTKQTTRYVVEKSVSEELAHYVADVDLRYRNTIRTNSVENDELLDLLVEYAKTPIEDREEEKLFTAKYLITGQYLNDLGGGKLRWLFEPSNFTEDELYKLGITYDSPEYEIKPVEDNIKWREE